ncbi:RNA cytidine acetyltransferase [Nasonia vitripennis]|uniref:RNA cytidine acetyltransferase n=1 Tax=Nasonia vitripennis TaxID=7425 RepID=A0A7M7GHN8_NASVI|nr:RNA cytidine acetyltransferase [Nasonia vitripennis]XP_008203063.1 RNA cytidine acetyltransferase [Nasonia vitripennis]XP_008203064.1 RNA cytidine acetyltransferase [Nasonia vitripennis]XP_031777691.1 RNA cytidine acetyltransferase [Nasonia vitripennis]
MVRKKIDNRIRSLIEDGVNCGHRTMFVVIGEKAKDQVVLLHHILLKSAVKAQPTVLWCYKKDLGFSSHRKKRMKQITKKAKSGKLNFNEDDPFDLFILSTKIRYCYYSETHKILGSTYDMCILQDFEALTPNLMARTLETVQGGGIIVFLLQSMNSLKQLYTMNMDVHQRFRTEAHQDVVCRFNERFLLSLASCERCLVVDDQLQVLPISSHNLNQKPSQRTAIDTTELDLLKKSLQDTQPVGAIVNCCKTSDQAKVLLKFIEAISEKTLRSTISLTAARGRGKSAALGLAIAGAVAFGYSNIYITSPSPENLKTVFEFISKGFEALNYQEHTDYEFFQSTNPEFNQATIRVNVFRDHRQTIQYIHPTDAKGKLSLAELLVIDEAAAIPLPHVKAMLGPYLTFMASTINGYEGTGRSLTLKLLNQLRAQTVQTNSVNKQEKDLMAKAVIGRELQELVLEEPIRYRAGDSIEKWLCDLLCLDATTVSASMSSGCPTPEDCQLYYINRDTLFSYHKASEIFLQRMMALCVSSHYKNSPNDLQMMSDAPAHHLFCLLGPVNPDTKTLPEILVVVQICLEGQINKSTISDGLGRGRRAAGDLIPWTVAQQFQDEDFPSLSGARVVRIATHPDYQGMGYGSRALDLLRQYYQLCIPSLEADDVETEAQTEASQVQDSEVDLLEETIEPKSSLPPLLLKLSERKPEHLDYLGVSFGVTESLLKFWKRAKFIPVYLRQTTNEITGEHSCIMLSNLQDTSADWLKAYWKDFRRRFISLLSSSFRDYAPSLALAILTNNTIKLPSETIQKQILDTYFTSYDVGRLEKYSSNMTDYHLIMDLVPPLARLYYLNLMGSVHFSPVQSAILLSLGLQHKTVDQVVEDLNKTSANDTNLLLASQVLGLFNRIVCKATKYLNDVIKNDVGSAFKEIKDSSENVKVSLQNGSDMQKELEAADKELKKKQKVELEKLKQTSLEQYAIKGSEAEWSNALKSNKTNKNLLSVKSLEKRANSNNEGNQSFQEKGSGNKKKGKKRKHSL